jgi:hypothetical protein
MVVYEIDDIKRRIIKTGASCHVPGTMGHIDGVEVYTTRLTLSYSKSQGTGTANSTTLPLNTPLPKEKHKTSHKNAIFLLLYFSADLFQHSTSLSSISTPFLLVIFTLFDIHHTTHDAGLLF